VLLPPVIEDRFARWTVIGESFMHSGHRAVLCRCDCGVERLVLVFALRSGHSTSCGCAKREQVATLVSRTRWKDKHGRAKGWKDPLYTLWLRIRKRCNNPKAHNYRWYGARGIQVCDEWQHDPVTFISYVEEHLGPRPPGKSLDRVDNDGDYRPGNLRWATQKEQVANSRNARRPTTDVDEYPGGSWHAGHGTQLSSGGLVRNL
jgi:hypothetical protein